MVLEAVVLDDRDEEIFRLQQLLYAAEERIHELESVSLRRGHDGKEIATGASHNETVLAEEEKAYRRGYSQGFSLCRQYVELATKKGVSSVHIAKILLHYESQIFRWRGKAVNWIRGRIVKAEWPPNPLHSMP
jgi:hypothetical protein